MLFSLRADQVLRLRSCVKPISVCGSRRRGCPPPDKDVGTLGSDLSLPACDEAWGVCQNKGTSQFLPPPLPLSLPHFAPLFSLFLSLWPSTPPPLPPAQLPSLCYFPYPNSAQVESLILLIYTRVQGVRFVLFQAMRNQVVICNRKWWGSFWKHGPKLPSYNILQMRTFWGLEIQKFRTDS